MAAPHVSYRSRGRQQPGRQRDRRPARVQRRAGPGPRVRRARRPRKVRSARTGQTLEFVMEAIDETHHPSRDPASPDAAGQ